MDYHPDYKGNEEQWIDDLVNGRLKDPDVNPEEPTDLEIVQEALSRVDLPHEMNTGTRLQTSSGNVRFTWSSSNTSVVNVAADGLVTINLPDETVRVTLTCTATLNEASDVKHFYLTYDAPLNTELVDAVNAITLPESLTDGMTLPTSSGNVRFMWSSSNAYIVSIKANGTVTIKAPDMKPQIVTLTCNGILDESVYQRTFEFEIPGFDYQSNLISVVEGIDLNALDVSNGASLPTPTGYITFTWTSSNNDVLSVVDNKFVINSPADDTSVTLTLTAESNGYTRHSSIDITIEGLYQEYLTIEEAKEREIGSEVTIRGIVAGFVYRLSEDQKQYRCGYYVADETDIIYVYSQSSSEIIAFGDEVYFSATYSLSGTKIQLTDVENLVIISSDNTPKESAVREYSPSEIVSLDKPDQHAYMFTGKIIRCNDGIRIYDSEAQLSDPYIYLYLHTASQNYDDELVGDTIADAPLVDMIFVVSHVDENICFGSILRAEINADYANHLLYQQQAGELAQTVAHAFNDTFNIDGLGQDIRIRNSYPHLRIEVILLDNPYYKHIVSEVSEGLYRINSTVEATFTENICINIYGRENGVLYANSEATLNVVSVDTSYRVFLRLAENTEVRLTGVVKNAIFVGDYCTRAYIEDEAGNGFILANGNSDDLSLGDTISVYGKVGFSETGARIVKEWTYDKISSNESFELSLSSQTALVSSNGLSVIPENKLIKLELSYVDGRYRCGDVIIPSILPSIGQVLRPNATLSAVGIVERYGFTDNPQYILRVWNPSDLVLLSAGETYEVVNNGTSESPYTAEEAFELIANGTYQILEGTKYVVGTVAYKNDETGTAIMSVNGHGVLDTSQIYTNNIHYGGDMPLPFEEGDTILLICYLSKYDNVTPYLLGAACIKVNDTYIDGTEEPIDEPEEVTHAGTLEDPYTVHDFMLRYADLEDDNASFEPVYITGVLNKNPRSGEVQVGDFFIRDEAGNIIYVTSAEKYNGLIPYEGDSVVILGYAFKSGSDLMVASFYHTDPATEEVLTFTSRIVSQTRGYGFLGIYGNVGFDVIYDGELEVLNGSTVTFEIVPKDGFTIAQVQIGDDIIDPTVDGIYRVEVKGYTYVSAIVDYDAIHVGEALSLGGELSLGESSNYIVIKGLVESCDEGIIVLCDITDFTKKINANLYLERDLAPGTFVLIYTKLLNEGNGIELFKDSTIIYTYEFHGDGTLDSPFTTNDIFEYSHHLGLTETSPIEVFVSGLVTYIGEDFVEIRTEGLNRFFIRLQNLDLGGDRVYVGDTIVAKGYIVSGGYLAYKEVNHELVPPTLISYERGVSLIYEQYQNEFTYDHVYIDNGTDSNEALNGTEITFHVLEKSKYYGYKLNIYVNGVLVPLNENNEGTITIEGETYIRAVLTYANVDVSLVQNAIDKNEDENDRVELIIHGKTKNAIYDDESGLYTFDIVDLNNDEIHFQVKDFDYKNDPVWGGVFDDYYDPSNNVIIDLLATVDEDGNIYPMNIFVICRVIHEGTIDDPLTPLDAIELGDTYYLSSNKKSENKMYVYGNVSSIENTDYCNFYITLDEGIGLFVYGLYNQNEEYSYGNLKELSIPFNVGDEVLLYGYVQLYMDDKGQVVVELVDTILVEINDTEVEEFTEDNLPLSPVNEGTLDSPYSSKDAIVAGSALEGGAWSLTSLYVTGYVRSIGSTYEGYYQNVIIADSMNTSHKFLVYRVYRDGEVSDIEVGDFITVRGYITNYNGNTPEMTGKSNGDGTYTNPQIVDVAKH